MAKLSKARPASYHRPGAWGTVRAYDDEGGQTTPMPDPTATAGISNLPSPGRAQAAQAHQDALYRIAIATAAGALAGGGVSSIASAASSGIPYQR